jgi:hypothetical protein
MGRRDPEQGHYRIADELLHRAAEPLQLRPQSAIVGVSSPRTSSLTTFRSSRRATGRGGQGYHTPRRSGTCQGCPHHSAGNPTGRMVGMLLLACPSTPDMPRQENTVRVRWLRV